MSADRILEILHGPLAEVNNDASLLGVERKNRETEVTFRTRVAYAFQAHVWKFDGKEVSEKIRERMRAWDEKAEQESLQGAAS